MERSWGGTKVLFVKRRELSELLLPLGLLRVFDDRQRLQQTNLRLALLQLVLHIKLS